MRFPWENKKGEEIMERNVLAVLTEEEVSRIVELHDNKIGLEKVLEDLVKQQTKIVKETEKWWKGIREKYEIEDRAVSLDRDTKEIYKI